MTCPTIEETRNNEDFAKHIKQSIATAPEAGWLFVVDNLNTHCGEPFVRMVADQLNIDGPALKKAEKHGFLKTMFGPPWRRLTNERTGYDRRIQKILS
ncbi:MAG: transposase [Pirellulaceae bacterium]|nr:transposase [Pirellulaceae bacterium]